MSARPSQGVVDRATDSDAFEYAARAGFAISGVLHLLVGYIILRIAFGSGGNADQSGALATIGNQTGGKIMLWIAVVGLVALGLWRLAEAVIGSKPGESSGRDRTTRPPGSGARPWRWRSSTSRSRSRRRASPRAAASPAASRTPACRRS